MYAFRVTGQRPVLPQIEAALTIAETETRTQYTNEARYGEYIARFIRITITNTAFDNDAPMGCSGSFVSGPALASLSLAPDASPSSQESTFPPAIATFDVYGSSPLPPDQNNPPKECPCGGSQGSAGGPFNTRTGALWTDTTDLTLPTDGPGIAFKRTYLSRTNGQQVRSATAGPTATCRA